MKRQQRESRKTRTRSTTDQDDKSSLDTKDATLNRLSNTNARPEEPESHPALDMLEDMDYVDKTPAYVHVYVENMAAGTRFRTCADSGSSISLIDNRLRQRHFRSAKLERCRPVNVKGVAGTNTVTQFIVLSLIFEDIDGRRHVLPTKLYVNPQRTSASSSVTTSSHSTVRLSM